MKEPRVPLDKATNLKRIPKFVTDQYDGGAKGFKAIKRYQVKVLRKALDELRTGCVYLPCGTGPIEQIAQALEQLQDAVSAKNWGH